MREAKLGRARLITSAGIAVKWKGLASAGVSPHNNELQRTRPFCLVRMVVAKKHDGFVQSRTNNGGAGLAAELND